MEGLYVYAITRGSTNVRARGICGRPLRSLRVGRLHVVVEPALRPPRPSLAKLKAQAKIVAALVDAGADLLPVRFGSHVASAGELRQALRARSAELEANLRRTRGCVQMTLRMPAASAVTRTAPAGLTRRAATGTEYLRARAATAAGRRHPLVAALNRAARPYVKAVRVDGTEEQSVFLRIHHLVPRGRVADYARAIARELARRDASGVSMSGPWAPFAFAEVA